jgi:copper(I)-binding protein
VTAVDAGPRTRYADAGHGRLAELARAAVGPVACAAVLIGLLSAWVAGTGAGTLTRVRIQVTLAAVPMRAFNPKAAVGAARLYLTIRNLAGTPDELLAVRTPIATDVALTERAAAGAPAAVVSGIAIPANATLTLSPLGDDVVLENPVPFEDRQSVPLTLVFRHAGQLTIDAPVTAPGTP